MKKVRSIAVSMTMVGVGLTAALTGAAPAGAASTQAYSCSTPIGTESGTATISGKAVLNATTKVITLSAVKFSIKNTFGLTISGNNIKVSVPDPNTTSAPYITGSAKVATTPAGWTAGHGTTGLFALHKGTLTFANGSTISNAALSGRYKDKGPKGTVISFKPGTVSFNLTSPISGTVTCTPSGTVVTFASVTE